MACRGTIAIPRSLFILSLALILAAMVAAPALADFLGPDRTVLELVTVRDPDNDVWTLINDDPPEGVLGVCLIIHTCEQHPGVEAYAPKCLWVEDDGTLNPAESSSCTEAYKEELQEVTYPEATISAELKGCSLVDGWCTGDPTLRLTASEPIAGEAITLIEGTRNGEEFACPGLACDAPLLQGENAFTFWAHSSWGDTSQMGTLSAKVDSQPPSIGIPASWKIWEPLTLSADDGGVGLESVSLTIHGGTYGNRKYTWAASVLPIGFVWDRYFGEVVAPIGEYAVAVTARDRVGNTSTAHGEIVIPAPESDSESESMQQAQVQSTAVPPAPTADPLPSTPTPQPTEMLLAAIVDEESAEPSRLRESLPEPPVEGVAVQPLWGAAAAALSYAAANLALSRRKKREQEKERLRREVARANAGRSLERRLATIWKSVQPIVTAIAVRQQAEREAIAAAEEQARQAARVQATTARWQAMADYYETKAAQEAAAATAELEGVESQTHPEPEMADPPAEERSPDELPSTAELVLEQTPSFRANPLGWAGASLINLIGMDNSVGRFVSRLLEPLYAPRGQSSTGGEPEPDEPEGTPVPIATPAPAPAPPVTEGTPVPAELTDYQRQLALNAKYGFCVYPLTDPDALENRIAEGGMAFGKGPFPALPGPAPGRTWEGYSTSRWQVALRSLGLVLQSWRREANYAAVANMSPNVEVDLHYALYEDGIKILGVRVENNHDIPIKVFWADVGAGVEFPDGDIFMSSQQPILMRSYVTPGSTEFIQFEGLPAEAYPGFMTVQVYVNASSVEYERQYRQITWRIDGETGTAQQVDSNWGHDN